MNYSKLRTVDKLDVNSKIVFLRLDLNVPVVNGSITSYKRINEALPTINYLVKNNAKIVILSHFGRPKTKEDVLSKKFSLEVVYNAIKKLLNKSVKNFTFVKESRGSILEGEIDKLKNKEILLLENTRFNDIDLESGQLINLESNCDYELSKYWASLCDCFVNDAFGAAHRKHASTFGIGKFNKNNAIGLLMKKELETLSNVVKNPRVPYLVIFGGAKVSDKIKAVNAVIKKASKVIISGGMAYTFVAAQGFDVGKSMVEHSMIDVAKKLMKKYPNKLCISSDFMCSRKFENDKPIYKTKEDGLGDLMGLDIGKNSINSFNEVIKSANTILWNGPMGVTEFSNYANGTNQICKAIAMRTKAGAFTVIGGGDSAAAAEKLKKESSFSFISTGGGASLRLIEGSKLEGIASIKH